MDPQSRDTLFLQVFQAGGELGKEQENSVSRGEKGDLNWIIDVGDHLLWVASLPCMSSEKHSANCIFSWDLDSWSTPACLGCALSQALVLSDMGIW